MTSMYYLPEDRNNGRYAKDIAQVLEFDGHRDLAIYMKAKGYILNDDIGNYEQDQNKVVEDELSE